MFFGLMKKLGKAPAALRQAAVLCTLHSL